MITIDAINSEIKKNTLRTAFRNASWRDTTWLGGGAERLSLRGRVKEKEFGNLLRGRTPNGKVVINPELTKSPPVEPDPKWPAAAAGWNIVLRPPQDMANMFSDAGWFLSRRLKAIHREAVTRAVSAFEEKFISRASSGVLFARLETPSQLLQTSIILFDCQLQAGGKVSRIDPKTISNAAQELGAGYHHALSSQLRSELGLVISNENHHGFSIQGSEAFSPQPNSSEKATFLGLRNPLSPRASSALVNFHKQQNKIEAQSPSPEVVTLYWNNKQHRDEITREISSRQRSETKSKAQTMSH